MAQKLKFGNGTWARKKGSTLAYNDQGGNFKPLPFTTTRDSKATRVNKEGLIEVVSNDVPRIDYTDSADGVLLLENISTNLVTHSEDFTDSSWDLLDATIENNSSLTTPEGINGVQELRENSDNDDHLIKSDSTFTSSDCSFSVFAKYKGNDRNIKLSLGTGKYASFNLQDGYVFDVQSSTTAEIIKLSNGWYRCVINGNISASKLNIILLNDTNEVYQGDGTSGIYIWGAMLEENSVASSYISTSGSSATRQADTASGSGNSEVFNDSEGVLFAEISALANDLTNRAITISDGTSNNRFFITYYAESNALFSQIIYNGVVQSTLIAKLTSITDSTKVLVKYKQNDFALWVNGFEFDSDESGFTPIGLDNLSFDRGTGTLNFYGKTKELDYYDEILTDLELETLTSYRSLNELVTELNLNAL